MGKDHLLQRWSPPADDDDSTETRMPTVMLMATENTREAVFDAMQRRDQTGTEPDRLEREKVEFFERARQQYLKLAAADAFGERDETLVQTISKKDFPPGVKVGGQLRGRTPEGQEQVFTVIKIKGDQVILDGNHPWAGQNLSLSLKVLEVRAASAEEVTHRHAHGAHGHHH